MKKENELLTKDIRQLIIQIAIPSSIGMFFNTMYNVVDTFYVGQISTAAISALSYSFMVFFLLLSVSFGLSSAITAYVGGALGKHKKAMAQIYVSNGIGLLFFISLFLSVVSFLLLETIFSLMGASGEVLQIALDYTYIISKLYQTGLFDIKLFFKKLPNLKAYKHLSIQAIPSSLNMFLMSFGSIITIYFVSFYGVKSVAAFGIGYRVEQIILLPMLGLNTAVMTIVSNNFGAKNFERIHEVINKALKYGYIMSAIGVVLIVLFGKYMVMIFDNDTEVIETAYIYIVVESLIFFAFITLFISVSTLQGIKKPFILPFVAIYRQILMPLILFTLVVKVYELPIEYLWVSMFLIIYSGAIYLKIYTNKKLALLNGK
ncbi:MAG: Multi antimicrobial extrusion protein (Na(+)/drug antiporter), MATE family of MDR efflux pumps [uncultured Sulfurovum sp.]|uniref:Multi antimicrobial extrusion protein (Na(+)/drug antiporter), MATE family of MDR efflux pumps n=2 Tax=uncultured Sulfurovum sp. TaxID=269237 RepID=A0A6S6SHZ8_9BACT|nr:MAG: Multi antimicrobial extrusion protein (Na(+)/drug antiporter), MATE family of MDR efflux pumps [uncultured Sulfurovum sp.]